MRRSLVVMAAILSLTAMLAAYALAGERGAGGEPYDRPAASTEDLVAVSEARIFFAHQSVGGNILDGVAETYRSRDMPPPAVGEVGGDEGDQIVHTRIGRNGDPIGKIDQFEALVRGGLGDMVDVAILKLCYSDVRADTDIDEVFLAYTDTISALQRDYPNLTVLAATVPLSIQRSRVGNVKEWLGRGDRYGPEHNLAREAFNARLRSRYAGTNLLFDVASMESTASDGTRVAALHDGSLYYSLDRAYAKDPGHLDAAGAAVVGEGFIAVVAQALRG